MSDSPSLPFLGRRALVTGGAVRVGRAIALGLAEAGCDVVIHYGRSADAAAETAKEITARGRNCDMVQGDLESAEGPGRVFAAALEGGRVDLLVNSAAHFMDGGLAETTPEIWDRQMGLNLRAPFLLSQAFAAQTDLKEGCIVNILDARNNRPGTDHFAYRLSKIALEEMTRNLALELAPRIRVNGVGPGAILPPPGAPQAHLDRIAADRVPLQRPGNPGQIAAAVRYLVEQDFLTGVVIPVDGGEFL